MSFVATTISEHIRNEGRIQGISEGKIEGKAEGKIEGKAEGKIEGKAEGQIQILENLYLVGILNQDQYDRMVQPLRKQLQEIQSDPGQSVDRPVRATKGRRKSKTSGQVEP